LNHNNGYPFGAYSGESVHNPTLLSYFLDYFCASNPPVWYSYIFVDREQVAIYHTREFRPLHRSVSFKKCQVTLQEKTEA
jgi:hypothetical protein